MFFRILTLAAFLCFFAIIAMMGFQTSTGLIITRTIAHLPFGDKGLHLLILSILTLLLNVSLRRRRVNLLGLNLLLGSILLSMGITLEECSQAFIPTRNFELLDMVCNYAGIFTGSLLCFMVPLPQTKQTEYGDYRSKTFSFQTIFHRTR